MELCWRSLRPDLTSPKMSTPGEVETPSLGYLKQEVLFGQCGDVLVWFASVC